jgi:rSAM-partnered protein
MVETARRSKIEEQRRGTPMARWEVFVRDEPTEPLRHVGDVAATDAETAVEHASRLFAWYADDLWVCPADAVARYSTRPLSTAETEPEPVSSEPRVYEETEGTPRVNDR